MKDRFMDGFVAGVTGAMATAVFNRLAVDFLNFGRIRYVDFAAIIMFGRSANGFWETSFAQIVQLAFSGVMGATFTYIIGAISKRYYWFKSILFGGAVWFVSYAIATLFKVPGLDRVDPVSAFQNMISSVLFGVVAAWVLVRLEKHRAR